MNKPLFEVQQAIIDKINGSDPIDCFDLDCELLTNGYQLESLQKTVHKIKGRSKKIAVVKACLSQYELHIIKTDHEFYQEKWDYGCAFKTYCEKLVWDLEEEDAYMANGETARHRNSEHDKLFAVMESDKAKALFARIPLMYYDGFKWRKGVPKTVISQFAHILSGILKIPDRKKWVYFEIYWDVPGLSKAFYSRNGRGLDNEVKSLFPEYEGV